MTKIRFTTGGRYPVLRSLAILCMVAAVLAAIAAIVAAVWIVVQLRDRSMAQRLLLALYWVCGGCLSVIAILALAEIVELFIDMGTSLRILALRQTGGAPSNGPATGGDRVEDESAEFAILRGR